MIIAISGTPGTGKTTASKLLARMVNANFLRIRDMINEIPHKVDKKRDTFVVDVRDLQKLINTRLVEGTNIIEGHLAHLLDVDIIIILRTNPDVLTERLESKGWEKSKVKENVKAEILDGITIEALEVHDKKSVFEIDTSQKSEEESAKLIKNILNKFARDGDISKYIAGKIDWTEDYRKSLIE